jgi:hypothetical protein
MTSVAQRVPLDSTHPKYKPSEKAVSETLRFPQGTL